MKNRSIVMGITLLFMVIALANCDRMPAEMPFDIPGMTAEETPTSVPAEPIDIIDTGISVEGRLVPKESVMLSFASAGKVEEVFFREGDIVQKGEIIARLVGKEQLESAVSTAEFELYSAQQARNLLDENLPVELNQTLQSLNDARQEVRDTERRAKYLETTAEQIDIDIANSQVIFAKNALEKEEDAWDKVKNLAEDNLRRANQQVKLAEAQRAYDDAVRKYNNLTGTVNDFDQQQANTKYEIALGKLEIAQDEYEKLQQGPASDAIATADARIRAAEASLEAAKADLNRLNIYATIDGKIVESDLEEGLAVTPGQLLVQIADFSSWYVDTDNLTEIEVVEVSPGMKVIVIPDALPDLELPGKVISISDTFEEKRGEITYTVRILMEEVDPRLRWGMTVITDFEQGG